jgi:hypothetical protein
MRAFVCNPCPMGMEPVDQASETGSNRMADLGTMGDAGRQARAGGEAKHVAVSEAQDAVSAMETALSIANCGVNTWRCTPIPRARLLSGVEWGAGINLYGLAHELS